MKKISELSFRKKSSLLFVLLVGTIYLIWLGSRLVGLVTYDETMGKVSDIDHYRTIRAKGNLLTGSDETKVMVAYDVNGVRYETTITERGDSQAYFIGMEEKVYYDPQNPKRAFVASGLGSLAAAPFVLGFLAVELLLIFKRTGKETKEVQI